MRSADHPQTLLRTGLARQLKKLPDDAYIRDLAHIMVKAAPKLLSLLHQADGYVELYFQEGELFLDAGGRNMRLLP